MFKFSSHLFVTSACKPVIYVIYSFLVDSENVTAEADKPAVMECEMSGFDQNPPAFEFAWYYDDLFIPRDHPRYFMSRLNSTTGTYLKIHKPCKCTMPKSSLVIAVIRNM